MKAENKRAYARSTTLLPVKVRRIPKNECEGLTCQLSSGTIVLDNALPPSVEDVNLNAWLNMLNAKLDYLIRLSPSAKQEPAYADIVPTNISGGGMSLVTREDFQLGETLEIKIVIQVYPPKVLHLYGNIVRLEEMPDEPDSHIVGINFFDLDETVRDEIIKFDFKKHKQRLARMKSN